MIEETFQAYRDVAEFRLVYIKEAHAADGRSPVAYAKEMGITEHDDIKERCTTAQKLIDDKSLTLPFLVDDMEDSVNKAYQAWPDRIFVVRTDGKLAVAASRGPFGFKPALEQTIEWLKQFKETGAEPALPEPKKTESKQDGNEDKGEGKSGGLGDGIHRPPTR